MKKPSNKPVSHYSNDDSWKSKPMRKSKALEIRLRKMKTFAIDDVALTKSLEALSKSMETDKAAYEQLANPVDAEEGKSWSVPDYEFVDYLSYSVNFVCGAAPWLDNMGRIRRLPESTLEQKAKEYLDKPRLEPSPSLLILPERYLEEQRQVSAMADFARQEIESVEDIYKGKESELERRLDTLRSTNRTQSNLIGDLRETVRQLQAQLEQERHQRIVLRERSITITERVRHFKDE